MSDPHISRFRTTRNLSQQEVANVMGESQSTVHRLEKNPRRARADLLFKYATAVGIEFSHLAATVFGENTGNTALVAPPADAAEPYRDCARRLDLVDQWVRESIDGLTVESASPPLLATQSRLRSRIEDVCNRLRQLPVLAVVGPFGAGKSTLVNALVGGPEDGAVTGMGPTTRLPLFIRHVDAMPPWITQSELLRDSRLFVMRRSADPMRWLTDQSVHVLTHGQPDLYRDLGIHQAASSTDAIDSDFGPLSEDPSTREADWAMLFIDHPILELVTILDTPGFLNSTEDSARTERLLERIDVLIYCSHVTSFLNEHDRYRLRNLIPRIRDSEATSAPGRFRRLFLVGTHANREVYPEEEMRIQIFDAANGLAEELASPRMHSGEDDQAAAAAPADPSSVDAETLRARTFLFWDGSTINRELADDLDCLVTRELPESARAVMERGLVKLDESTDPLLHESVQAINRALDTHEELVALLPRLEANEPNRKSYARREFEKLRQSLPESRQRYERRFEVVTSRLRKEDSIRNLLSQRSYGSDRTTAERRFVSDILVDLSDEWVLAQQRAASHLKRRVADFVGVILDRMAEPVGDPGDLKLVRDAFSGGYGSFSIPSAFERTMPTLARFAGVLEIDGSAGSTPAMTIQLAALSGFEPTIIGRFIRLISSYRPGRQLWPSRLAWTVRRLVSSKRFSDAVTEKSDLMWAEIERELEAFYEAIESAWSQFLHKLEHASSIGSDATASELVRNVEQIEALRDALKTVPFLKIAFMDGVEGQMTQQRETKDDAGTPGH